MRRAAIVKTGIRPAGPDDQVIEAVIVHVTRRTDGFPQPVGELPRTDLDRTGGAFQHVRDRRVDGQIGSTEDDVGIATRVAEWLAHHQVIETVAVEIAYDVNGIAELCAGRITRHRGTGN